MTDPWFLWLMAGLILLILEVLTPGFILACFGIAAILASASAGIGFGLNGQLIVFAFGILLSGLLIRPIFFKLLKGDQKQVSNIDAYRGKVGQVTLAIDPVHNSGRVKVGGEDWKAALVTPSAEPIPAGTTVTVDRIEGATIFVIIKETV